MGKIRKAISFARALFESIKIRNVLFAQVGAVLFYCSSLSTCSWRVEQTTVQGCMHGRRARRVHVTAGHSVRPVTKSNRSALLHCFAALLLHHRFSLAPKITTQIAPAYKCKSTASATLPVTFITQTYPPKLFAHFSAFNCITDSLVVVHDTPVLSVATGLSSRPIQLSSRARLTTTPTSITLPPTSSPHPLFTTF